MNTRSYLRELIKTLDIYGVRVGVNFNNQQIHKTEFGSIVSIFVVFLFLLGCYANGIELIEKKKPIIITNEKYIRNPMRMSFDKIQQTVMMGITNSTGLFLNDPSVFQVTSRMLILQKRYNETTKLYDSIMIPKPLRIKQCSFEDIKSDNLKTFISKLPLNYLFCFDDDQEIYVEGDYSGDFYSRVDVYFKQCVNSTQPDSIVCKPQDQIDKMLGFSHFMAYMVDKLVDPANLDNPFDYQGFNIYTPQSNKQSKELTAYFANYYIQTDVGIIQEQIEEKRDFLFAGQEETVSYEDPAIITKFVLRPLKNKETILQRRYMKISDLVAQLGGLLKVLTVVGYVITYPFVKFHMNKEIINSIFDFDISENSNKKVSNETQQYEQINPTLVNQEQKVQSQKSIILGVQDKNERSKNGNPQQQQQSQQKISFNLVKKSNLYISDRSIRNPSKKMIGQQQQKQDKQLSFIIHRNQDNQGQQIAQVQSRQDSIGNNTPLFKKQLNQKEQKCNKESSENISQLISDNSSVSPQKQFEDQKILEVNNFSTQKTCGEGINNEKDTDKKYQLQQTIMNWVRDTLNPLKSIIKYTTSEYFAQIFYPISNQMKEKKFVVQETIKKVQEHLDIKYILNKFQEIDKLKKILLTKDQIKLFELLPKPVIKNEYNQNKIESNNSSYQENKTYQEKIDEAYQSLINILNKDKKSQRDYKLIELLDHRILDMILDSTTESQNRVSFSQKLRCKIETTDNNDEIIQNESNLYKQIRQLKSSQYYTQNCQNDSVKENNNDFSSQKSEILDEKDFVNELQYNFTMIYNKNSQNTK